MQHVSYQMAVCAMGPMYNTGQRIFLDTSTFFSVRSFLLYPPAPYIQFILSANIFSMFMFSFLCENYILRRHLWVDCRLAHTHTHSHRECERRRKKIDSRLMTRTQIINADIRHTKNEAVEPREQREKKTSNRSII